MFKKNCVHIQKSNIGSYHWFILSFQIPGNDVKHKFRMNKITKNSLKSIFLWIFIDNFVESVRFIRFVNNYDFKNPEFCSKLVTRQMGTFLGDAIAISNFFNTTRPKLLNILGDIRTKFNELVENSDWMDEITKEAVIEKANAMKMNVGFPEFLLNKTKSDTYLKDLNLMEHSLADNLDTMQKVQEDLNSIGEWDVLNKMPTDINAYYYPSKNTLSKHFSIYYDAICTNVCS